MDCHTAEHKCLDALWSREENGELLDSRRLKGYPQEKKRSITEAPDTDMKFNETIKPGATIGDMLRALKKSGRVDLAKELQSNIKEAYQVLNANPRDLESLLLTNRSLVQRHSKQDSKVYDAMVIYSQEDVAFATHLFQRMEAIKNQKLKIFVAKPVLDMNTKQHIADIISSGRCKKVIAVLSTSFFNDPSNNYYLEIAIRCAMKTYDAILLPVIYGNQRIHNVHPCIDVITKLKYNSNNTFTNFWRNLMKSFNIYDLTEQEMEMDFRSCSSSVIPTARSENNSSCESLSTICTILDSAEYLAPKDTTSTTRTKRRLTFKNSKLKIPIPTLTTLKKM